MNFKYTQEYMRQTRDYNILRNGQYSMNFITWLFKKLERQLSKKDSIINEVYAYIERLENDSFECWSEDAESGYKTATVSIKEKIKELSVED